MKHLYGYLSVLPFVPFIIVYAAALYRTRDKKRSLRLAMDITMVFLIGIVAGLFNQVFGSTFGFYGILLVMLIGAGLLGNVQYRVKGRVDMARIARAIWRIGFFVMSVCYILLMAVGVSMSLLAV